MSINLFNHPASLRDQTAMPDAPTPDQTRWRLNKFMRKRSGYISLKID